MKDLCLGHRWIRKLDSWIRKLGKLNSETSIPVLANVIVGHPAAKWTPEPWTCCAPPPTWGSASCWWWTFDHRPSMVCTLTSWEFRLWTPWKGVKGDPIQFKRNSHWKLWNGLPHASKQYQQSIKQNTSSKISVSFQKRFAQRTPLALCCRGQQSWDWTPKRTLKFVCIHTM